MGLDRRNGTSLPAPASLFDAAVHPGRSHELEAVGLRVVARPGHAEVEAVRSGDLLLRRGLGEGRLAVAMAVEGEAARRAELEALGVECEGAGDGLFVEVFPGRDGRRVARMLTGPDGAVRRDTVVLRDAAVEVSEAAAGALAAPAGEGVPWEGEGVPWEDEGVPWEDDPSVADPLIAAAIAARGSRRRTLREETVRELLAGRGAAADELARATADLQARLPAAPADARQALLDEAGARILTAAERQFILDPARSTLDLLPPEVRDRYRRFRWHADDYPGKPVGPNEAAAEAMFAALTQLRPERRVNQGEDAVVKREEYAGNKAYIQSALVDVPGEQGKQLHRDASAAYVAARAAAAAEGVHFSLADAFRSAERAAAGASKADNAKAVARYSSHMLGLAIDLNVSQGTLRFREATTRPFQNVVDMYRSPAHKWMFLRGDAYSWYPYGREPWHWEYNPAGYREQFRPDPVAASEAAPAAAPARIDDPIAPVRPALALKGAVGRGAANHAADVAAVQARLVELRELDAADAAAERPGAGPTVQEAALPKTIAALEHFQQHRKLHVTGTVNAATRGALDTAIPVPTQAEWIAVATRRAAIAQAVSKGMTIGGPVGATSGGNAPADVRAVQGRLVEVGLLHADHGESPAAGATAPVPQARLARTILAIEGAARVAGGWKAKGLFTGGVHAKRVVPGDATAQYLDAVSVYGVTTPDGVTIRFHDHHLADGGSPIGVQFLGSVKPSAVPAADYMAIGLSAKETAALQEVSRNEGGFDAINTYDVARVSVGFIQFAGSGGLAPYLAFLKARHPALFRDLLQSVGIDVEFTAPGGALGASQLAVLEPSGRKIALGIGAEEAIRADKRLTAALASAGRRREAQWVQIEVAAREFVRKALDAVVSWGATSAPLRQVVRSELAIAVLVDRQVQEGHNGPVRFERVIRAVHAKAPAATAAALAAREGEVLDELQRDLTQAAEVGKQLGSAIEALRSASKGDTVQAILGSTALAEARAAVAAARAGLDTLDFARPAISSAAGVAARLIEMKAALDVEATRLAFPAPPGTAGEAKLALQASALALGKKIRKWIQNAPMLLARVTRLRGSHLSTATARVEVTPGAGTAVAVGPSGPGMGVMA